MQFSEAWLKELVAIPSDTQALSHQLTMSGLEVGQVVSAAADFSHVVVGYIESKEKHPDADKLHICQVNLGDEVTQIVCGAKNVDAGQKVPVAKIGAILPNGLKIKKAKLRGIASNGMICSETEIGLSEKSDGILVLPDDAPLGDNIRDYLKLDDSIIDIDLTANRGDCLSLIGIAREVAVANKMTFKPPKVCSVKSSIQDTVTVNLQEDSHCLLYVSRVIKNINAAAKTPLWITEKLRRSGIRSIHPVVDVTNYVMILFGQPMHSFDLDKVSGCISVCKASGGEKLTLLNESEIECNAGTLIINDDDSTIALAGIMGGLKSSVTTETTQILLESAHFTPSAIRGKARQYGLHTDSSHRFERGVDLSLPSVVMEFATKMIIEICGGQAGLLNCVGEPKEISEHIALNFDHVSEKLGLDIPAEAIIDILNALGFLLEGENKFIVPSYRFDINIEEDLIEEIARVVGLDNIRPVLPHGSLVSEELSEKENTPLSILEFCASRGFHQALNYKFIDPKWQNIFYSDTYPPVLKNPISSEMSQMRGLILPGLLLSAKHNLNRQMDRVHLCEQGHIFTESDEIENIAFVKCGLTHKEHFSGSSPCDFYDLKGDIESLGLCCGHLLNFKLTTDIQFLHPGRSALILSGDKVIGFIGELHPVAQSSVGLKLKAYVAEMSWVALKNRNVSHFKPLSKFPSIRRDLALIVDKSLPANRLVETAYNTIGEICIKASVFDIYMDESLGADKKSLALSLILQDLSHTLIEEEINSVVNSLLKVFESEFYAKLRK